MQKIKATGVPFLIVINQIPIGEDGEHHFLAAHDPVFREDRHTIRAYRPAVNEDVLTALRLDPDLRAAVRTMLDDEFKEAK